MKAIAFLRRKDGMSFEDFAQHLLEEHGPFMRDLPGLQKWTVNLAIHGEDPAPYDAITEFWFEDQEAFEAAMASDEVAAALRDGEEFVAPPWTDFDAHAGTQGDRCERVEALPFGSLGASRH
jgi:uncharacterized protein (TIGR02118 family)